jgi:hypothetical protein
MRRANHSGLLTAAVAWACAAGSAVQWSEPVAAKVASAETELVVDSTGRVRWVPLPEQPAWPRLPGACAQSIRARAGSRALYGVWWTARADSSAVLVAGRSADRGTSWQRTIVVDSADASAVGCRRPPPSIAVVADDVFVAYAMKAPDGTGVFFAHSMDGTSMFHAPVAIVYGDRLVPSAVASDGQRVAVAYEEPNGAARSVGVALSRTQGHIFEARVPASTADNNIMLPYVAIAGPTIAVGWTLHPGDEQGLVTVTRVGRMHE